MSIFRTIFREIEKLGEPVTITTEEGSIRTKSVIAPLLYKNKMYLGGVHLPDGFFDTGHYLLILPADVRLPVLGTAFFQFGKNKYVLKRSERVSVKNYGAYVWAVVAPYKENLEEDYDEI
ncbi:MAG: hypothetical protein IJF19_03435 [Clostridia bacterium]|nr:hypothetical protein [Clostridia bacterium]